jgi:hypothetical protein
VKDKTAIAAIAYTMEWYPNILFLEKVGKISDITPKAGSIII